MGTCTSLRPSRFSEDSNTVSSYGKYSKVKDIDAFADKLRKEEFKRIIDKLYIRYDANSDGILELDEIKCLLKDILCRRDVGDDDVHAILRLNRSDHAQHVQKE
jgi:hypothetical protein